MTLQRRIYESRIQNLPENKSSVGQVGSDSSTFSGGIASGSADITNPVTTGMKKPGKKGTSPTIQYWDAKKGEFEERDDLLSWEDKTKADNIFSHSDAVSSIIEMDDPVNGGALLGGIMSNAANEIVQLRKSMGTKEANKLISTTKDSIFSGTKFAKLVVKSTRYRNAVNDSGIGLSIGDDGTLTVSDSAAWKNFSDNMDAMSKNSKKRNQRGGNRSSGGNTKKDEPASASLGRPILPTLLPIVIKPGPFDTPGLPGDENLWDILGDLWTTYEVWKYFGGGKAPPPPPIAVTPSGENICWFPPDGYPFGDFGTGFDIPEIPVWVWWVAVVVVVVVVVATAPAASPQLWRLSPLLLAGMPKGKPGDGGGPGGG